MVEGGPRLGPWLVVICQWLPIDLGKKMIESTRATELEPKMGQPEKEPTQDSLDRVDLSTESDDWIKPAKIARW